MLISLGRLSWEVAAMLQRLVVGLVIVMVSIGVARAADDDVAKATEAARSWLALTDAGRYGDGWDQAAAFLRGAVTRERFTHDLKGVRAPLGAVRSRKVFTASHTHQLPGAPDGDYVVIRFDAVFENKAHAIETVTPMKEKDGSWRV